MAIFNSYVSLPEGNAGGSSRSGSASDSGGSHGSHSSPAVSPRTALAQKALQQHMQQILGRIPAGLGKAMGIRFHVDIDVDGYHHWEWNRTRFFHGTMSSLVLGAFKLSTGHQSFGS